MDLTHTEYSFYISSWEGDLMQIDSEIAGARVVLGGRCKQNSEFVYIRQGDVNEIVVRSQSGSVP